MPGRFVFGKAEVDVLAHTLIIDGTACELQPKAYAVLLQLLKHPGEVVSKDALLDAVWGHRCVTPNVLARAIAQIRHALSDSAHEPAYIETVPTLGYRLLIPVRRDDRPQPSSDYFPKTAQLDNSNLLHEIAVAMTLLESYEQDLPVLFRHLHFLSSVFGDRPSGMLMFELAMQYGLDALVEHELELPWRHDQYQTGNGRATSAKNQITRRKTS